jgi:tetratricopeptide (TPR) repeat protein
MNYLFCMFIYILPASQDSPRPDAKAPAVSEIRGAGEARDRSRREADVKLAEAKKLQDEIPKLSAEGRLQDVMKATRRIVDIRREALGEKNPAYAASLNHLGRLLWSQGDLAGAQPLIEQALRIEKENLGESHPDYAKNLDNLAFLFKAQGKLDKARKLFEEGARIRKEALGWKHVDYANALDNLAKLALDRGDFVEARRLFQEAMAIRKEAAGEYSSEYATSMINLALLDEKMGNVAGAEALIRGALAIQFSTDRRSIFIDSLDDVAASLQEIGDLPTARLLLEHAVARRKEESGIKHPDYATSLNNLGMLLWAQNDLTGARELIEEALRIRKEAIGERHPAYLTSLNNLAVLLQAKGDFAAAKPLFEKTLALRKEVLGERSPDYAVSLANLAEFYRAQGVLGEARRLLELSVATRLRGLGGEHASTATGLTNLASTARAQGDLAAAGVYYERALRIREKTLGPKDINTLISLTNLASVYHEQGRLNDAKALFERAAGAYQAIKAKNRGEPAAALFGLGTTALDRGDYATARDAIDGALVIRFDVLGNRHPDYINTLAVLGEIEVAAGRFDRGESRLEQVRDLRSRGRGTRGPGYAGALGDLAALKVRAGDFDRARKLSIEELAIRRDTLGEGHPGVAFNRLDLALIALGSGDAAGALDEVERSLELFEGSVAKAAPALVDRQGVAIDRRRKVAVDLALSLTKSTRDQDAKIYKHVLSWKGFPLATTVARRRLDRDSKARDLIAAASRVRTRLSAAYAELALVGGDEIENKMKHIHDLVAERGRLEAELAGRSTAGRADSRPEVAAAALPRKSVLIDFVLYEDQEPIDDGKSIGREPKYAAFVLKPAGAIERLELGAASAIDFAIEASRRAIFEPGRDPTDELAAVKKRVWTPLESKIQGADYVLISPDGAIDGVLWDALPGAAAGSYLIEKYAFMMIPEAGLLCAPRAEVDRRAKGALIAANVDFDRIDSAVDPVDVVSKSSSETDATAGSTRTSPLVLTGEKVSRDGAAGERAKAIANAVRASGVEPVVELSGGSATRLKIESAAADAKLIVIATSGLKGSGKFASAIDSPRGSIGLVTFESITRREIVGYDRALLEGLTLSGFNIIKSQLDDNPLADRSLGFATVESIADWNLSGRDAIVIAPVAGSKGEFDRTPRGAASAFVAAGARGVVTSLGGDDPESTELFLSLYLKNLYVKKQSCIDAFRAARLELMRGSATAAGGAGARGEGGAKRPTVKSWGTFVLWGDPR